MSKKEYLLVIILTWILWFAIAPIRGYHFMWAEIAHSIAFIILTWWMLTKFAPKAGIWRLLLILSSPWLFELVMRLFTPDNLFSLPVTVLPLWAVISVVIFYHYRKLWMLAIFAGLWLLGVTEGHKQWAEWISYRDKPTLSVVLADCEVSDNTHTFKLSEVESEYLVLDVWYSGCGVCLKKMPEVEALRNEYKSKKEVEIASIFVCMDDGETIEDGCRIMKERSYDIPVWVIDAYIPLLRECEIKSYPRVLILDKERRVIFNGSLGFAKRKLNILL